MLAVRTRAALAVLVVATAACTGADAADDGDQAVPTVVQPGGPGEPSRLLDPDEVPDERSTTPHTEADVAFMQGMILHHVQALRMTRLVPDRTSREDLPLFAERMDISQESELELMRDWLEARDEDVPALTATHAHGEGDAGDEGALMPGMLTEEELLALEAADGEAFDRAFLEGMIRHHLGALEMVDTLFAAGGGQETEVFQFASHVRSDQEIELDRMDTMLAELDAD